GNLGPLPRPPSLFALCPHLFQALAEILDPGPEQTAVGLQLGFPGAAQTNPALLPFQVSPAPDQPGRHMLKLSQLDLQLTFVSAGPLSKDIENHASAIQHPAF